MSTEIRMPEINSHTPKIIPVYRDELDRYKFDEMPVEVWDDLRRRAQYTAHEICGMITDKWNVEFIRNIHPDPQHHFLMDENEMRRAIERIVVANERVIGVFHTHPGGNHWPSAGDISGWPNRDLNWRYWIATPVDVWEYRFHNQPEHSRSIV